MPALASKFKTYNAFALAKLTDIYSLKDLVCHLYNGPTF